MEVVTSGDDAAVWRSLDLQPLQTQTNRSSFEDTPLSSRRSARQKSPARASPRNTSAYVSPYTALPWSQEQAYLAIIDDLENERASFEQKEAWFYNEIFNNASLLRPGQPAPPGGGKGKLLETSLQQSPYRMKLATPHQVQRQRSRERSRSPPKGFQGLERSRSPNNNKLPSLRKSRSPNETSSSLSPPRSQSVANDKVLLDFNGAFAEDLFQPLDTAGGRNSTSRKKTHKEESANASKPRRKKSNRARSDAEVRPMTSKELSNLTTEPSAGVTDEESIGSALQQVDAVPGKKKKKLRGKRSKSNSSRWSDWNHEIKAVDAEEKLAKMILASTGAFADNGVLNGLVRSKSVTQLSSSASPYQVKMEPSKDKSRSKPKTPKQRMPPLAPLPVTMPQGNAPAPLDSLTMDLGLFGAGTGKQGLPPLQYGYAYAQPQASNSKESRIMRAPKSTRKLAWTEQPQVLSCVRLACLGVWEC